MHEKCALTIKDFYVEIWKMVLASFKSTEIVVIPSSKDVISMYPLP